MALLSTQSVITAGTTPSFAAATSGGDTYVPGTGKWIHIKNGGGGSITATFVTPGVIDGTLTIQDRAVAVANGADALIAVPAALYQDPTTGLGSITYSGVSSVTIACFQI